MTEILRGREAPEMPTEVCPSCQAPAPHPDSATSDDGGPNGDQEMQWLSAKADSPPPAPPLNCPPFPVQAQEGPYPFGGLSLELCEEEEEMCRDPAEPPCEETCVWEPPEALCGGRHCCGQPCHERECRMPERHLYEDPYGGPWPGKARPPSIVVVPSEGEEVESGELRWPPEDFLFLEEKEEERLGEQDELFRGGEEALDTGLSSFDSDVEEVLL